MPSSLHPSICSMCVRAVTRQGMTTLLDELRDRSSSSSFSASSSCPCEWRSYVGSWMECACRLICHGRKTVEERGDDGIADDDEVEDEDMHLETDCAASSDLVVLCQDGHDDV